MATAFLTLIARELAAAGLSGEALFAALERIESADNLRTSADNLRTDEQAERRRAADRERARMKRDKERAKKSADSLRTELDKESPPKSSPYNPLKITPEEREIAGARDASEDLAIAIEDYETLAHDMGLSKIRKLDERRKTSLRARLKDCGGLAGWRAALAKVRASPYLCGDNDRGWRADLDFLLQAKSFNRLLEGGYDQRPRNGGQPSIAGAIDDIQNELRARGIAAGH